MEKRTSAKVFSLIMEAGNNTRLRMNKGHSPFELREIMDSNRREDKPREIVVKNGGKLLQTNLALAEAAKNIKNAAV